jgi:probable rRNA maturation factor
MTRAQAPGFDIVVQSALWKRETGVRKIVRDALVAAARAIARHEAQEVAIVLTDDASIQVLNRQWRGFDKATNVLSFPSGDESGDHLGDIVIAYETMTREAETERKLFAHHLAHMVVHGYLHLVGFDHEVEKEAVEMETREREILAAMGIANPYEELPETRVRKPAVKSKKAVVATKRVKS